MAGDPQFGPAPNQGARRAPLPPQPRDPQALREAVDRALAAAHTSGDVYSGVIRPALLPFAGRGGGDAAERRRALASSGAHAALAGLSGAHDGDDHGAGRRAVVLLPPGTMGELDAHLLEDVLAAGGWRVDAVALEAGADEAVDAIADAELVVLPAADHEQVLAAQRACSVLRRQSAPPLIVAVAFAPGPDAGELPADAILTAADDLPPLLRRRLPSGGARWGVRLQRSDDGGSLVVAPLGILTGPAAGRLRDVVESRRPLYATIVVDLRELLSTDAAGLGGLVAWDAAIPWAPGVSALADPRALDALREAGFEGALPLTEAA
jgi:hypothetical protein